MKIVFAPYRRKIWRKTIFHHVRIWQIFLTFDEKNPAVSWKLLPTCPEENFAGLFRYNLTFKTILDFGEKISAGFHFQSSKLYSKCPGEKSREWLFFKNSYFFYHFRARSQNNWAVCQKLFNRVVRDAFNLSIGKFWGKMFFLILVCFSFLHFYSEIFSVLAEKLGPCCQNSFLNVQRSMSRKNFLSEKLLTFFINFEFWADIFWPWVGCFSARLSKLQSTCP